jgi:hypothetical protein
LYAWFLQDSATVHSTDDSLIALEGVFCNRIISRGYGQHVCLILPHATFVYGVIGRMKSTEQPLPPY